MKIYVFLFLLICQSQAISQQVVPLFRDNSLITNVSIPFTLRDSQQQPLEILNIEVTSSKTNCLSMIDPFISSNFLVKCLNADALTVSVFYAANGKTFKINYGPVPITKIAGGAVIQPITAPTQSFAAGEKLFVQYCMRCHQSAYDKQNRSATQIKSAIAGVGAMKTIQLTDTDIKSISAYLSNLK